MNVVGLDLSLTATGIAHCDGTTDTWSPKEKGPARLKVFRERVIDTLTDVDDADLVVIEDYAYAGKFAHSHELGELGGVVRLALHDLGARWVAVTPTCLKKYATGRGNAKKVEMLLAAAKRLGYDGTDDNQADALWLRAMALDVYGHAVVRLPVEHRASLGAVPWPDIPGEDMAA